MKLRFKVKQRTLLLTAIFLLTWLLVADALQAWRLDHLWTLLADVVIAISVQWDYWRNWRHAVFRDD